METLRSNELRIGNHTSLGYVYLIENNNYYVINDECTSYKNTWAEINPIPLTEEWLVKFGLIRIGFNEDGNDIYTKGMEADVWIIKCGDVCWLYQYDYEIKYVHSLQNLYFALTGEELTIN